MKRRELTDEERDAWLEENGQKPKATRKEKPAPAPAKKTAPASRPLALEDTRHLDKKRLTTRIEATLDLHGLTQDEAHIQVVNFIKNAAVRCHKAVLIITGKGRQGGGILRHAVPKWLDTAQLRPFILAVTYATPKEGGEGALRVLLKKQR